MSLSDTSIKNPVFAWMVMLGMILFGWIAFMRLGVSQLPDVDFPMLSVSTSWEGGAPEVIETEVTDVIEGAVMGIQGVQEVTSSSRQGQSFVTIQFDLNKNIDVALQEVQSCIARAQRQLPRDIDPPVIMKSNPEDQPIIWLTLSGNRPLKYLMEYTRDHLKDQFATVPGVGEVSLGGYVDPNLRVWLDAGKMRRNELTVDDVINAIQTEHSEVPAGYIDTGNRELNVRVVGEAASVKEFSSIVIPSRRGQPMWKRFVIGDVARVEEGLADIRRISRTMDQSAVGLGIKKQRGTNAVAVAHAVKSRMHEMQKYLPKDVKLEVRFDTTTFVEDSMREMYFVMFLSVLLTALVCWLFIGSFNSALNVFLTIPMSIFGTFFVINILGFTLNMFTVLGLSLVIGIVVDDAIMMLENIVRHRENGETRIRSAIIGSREITFAAVAATMAILAIFVPVVFMKGIIGKYFYQFGVTISVAVMISLLGALTLTPMYCAQFLQIGHTTALGRMMDGFMAWLKRSYTATLTRLLEHRWQVIGASVVFFAASLFVLNFVKKEFVPAQEQSRLMVKIQTKPGSSIEYTNGIMKSVEKILSEQPEIESYFSNIGGYELNSGNISITLKEPAKRPKNPKKKRPLTQQEIIPVLRKMLKEVPGVRKAVVQDPSLIGFSARRGFPVEFTLTGPELGKLASLSAELEKKMEESGLMADVDSDYETGLPEVRVVPDRKNAAERGVSINSIGTAINSLVGGVRVGYYSQGGRRNDIRVQLAQSDRSKIQDISKIWVRNNRGEVIKLSDVVEINQKPSLLSITRNNRERAIRMFANIAPGKSQGEALAAVQTIANKTLPEGYKVVLSGSAQTYTESFQSLYVVLILGIFVAYMVLGTQFNSFIHPFTVLLALPFSVSGAFFALAITGKTLNIYSVIGLILLMGIVKKNSILLVDFTNQRRGEGLNVKEALLNACPLRLRPIIMTSFSTIAAAVPPALALGPGAESRVPMAVVIIGGVTLSTLLTLFVVPCAYSLLTSLESRKHMKDVHEALRELTQSDK
jgi:HAE1 family hydrophobic/amphiphilic exporter-1